MASSAQSTTLSRTANVLLVEDEDELADLLKAELEAAGYHVELGRNGREGLDYLGHATPDVIVTDVVMPEMDGLEFIRNLRAKPNCEQVPVIVLSSKRKIADIIAGFDTGADDYITKPVEPAELVARVHAKVDRPTVPADQLWHVRHSNVLSEKAFRIELQAESQRALRVGYPITVALVALSEAAEPPPETAGAVTRQIKTGLASEARPLDLIGRSGENGFLLMMPGATEFEAARRLQRLSQHIAGDPLDENCESPGKPPLIGYGRVMPGEDADVALERLQGTLLRAAVRRGHKPVRYRPSMGAPNQVPFLERFDLLKRERLFWRDTLGSSGPVTVPETAPERLSRLLLVEDDPDLAAKITADLDEAGYFVEHARNGREGIEHAKLWVPDLIVSDVMMPVMNGLEFLTAIRADEELRRTPVIMLTTRRKAAQIVEGFGLGADDYVTKPVDPAELVARVRAKIERPPVPGEDLRQDRQSGFLSAAAFAEACQAEMHRGLRAGYSLTAASIDFAERVPVRERIGPGADGPIARQVAEVLAAELRPLDLIGRSAEGGYLVLMPEVTEDEAAKKLERISQTLIGKVFTACGEFLHLTPIMGFADAIPAEDAEDLLERMRIAQSHAEAHLDLQPARYQTSMVVPPKPDKMPKTFRGLIERLRFPLQIAATFVLGWGLPYALYHFSAMLGHDITKAAYIVVVVSLVLTCTLIWLEGFMALKRVDPPADDDMEYPTASAIIAAYLPNEAATIFSTLEAMLNVDYPGQIQIILAYNTPKDMPIEKTLREMAAKDSRLEVVRVIGSTSKAQNVNAAIAYSKGAFTAIFDADHQPDPDSFTRAWQWINSGADVVQGHCLIRNGDASWVARMVAVEFEQIYTVSHPGRSRLHKFGIFGGSNGFWRTDLLRRIRMRGFMLTEDIDSALRVVEEGGNIVSDPYLISRELSPTTFKGLANQRLRWAQGWYQVTNTRLPTALKSKNLSIRQKVGMFYLLAWREFFPWISMQIVPIIAYWAIQAGSLAAIDWTVPLLLLITIYVMSTGPGQMVFISRLADPEIRKRRWWLVFYVFIAFFMYAEFKNLLSRVSNIKEWLKEKEWKVTPRS